MHSGHVVGLFRVLTCSCNGRPHNPAAALDVHVEGRKSKHKTLRMRKSAYLIQPSSTKRHFCVSLQPVIFVCPISLNCLSFLQPDGTLSNVEKTRAYLTSAASFSPFLSSYW